MTPREKAGTALPVFVFLVACSGLDALSPEALEQARAKWESTKPGSYLLVVAMEGDRVERGEFEVLVEKGKVVGLKRNGMDVNPAAGQDYSMDGLFRMIGDELELAKNPTLLGAPAGYSAYLMARFDESTGRLIQYRRAVGGATNSIDITVLRFEPRPGDLN